MLPLPAGACASHLDCQKDDKVGRCLRDDEAAYGHCVDPMLRTDLAPYATTVQDLHKQNVTQGLACERDAATHNYSVPAPFGALNQCAEQEANVTDVYNKTYQVFTLKWKNSIVLKFQIRQNSFFQNFEFFEICFDR